MTTDRAEHIIRGRIATLAGESGWGWVEAIAIRSGRVVAAGRAADIEGLSGPGTRRFDLEPDEVAIPGLTDAHIHLADAAVGLHQVDLSSAPTVGEGLRRVAAAHAALVDPDAWLLGQGWEADRWGGWPVATELDRVAPRRRIALWAHDHHALWVSTAALQAADIGARTSDPAGGAIRRDSAGGPSGVLHEAASGLVMALVPPTTADEYAAAIPTLARTLVGLGIVAVHDPGCLVPDAELRGAVAAYARLADAGRLALRVHACLRQQAVDTAERRGLRSGTMLGADPEGRARLGWQKLFADGTLGSRTAALLEPIEAEPGQPLATGMEHGLFITPPDALAELTARAAAAGIATQIHGIGDAAVRAALDALAPHAGASTLMARVEHVQLVHPDDIARFGRQGIAASVQPVHLRSDAAQARLLWGSRAERFGYAWRSLSAAGAVMPFGTDAPVEPIDPWPGLAMAVSRAHASWASGTAPFGPQEALGLERAIRSACIDGPRSAGETDRGRLNAGQRADLVILDAAVLREPVTVGGPLGTARPRRVLMDGLVVAEGA